MPAWLYPALSALFWSGNFIVGRAIAGTIDPWALSLWRWLLAALVLLPWVIKPMWQQRGLLGAHWPLLLVLSALGVSCFNTFAYLGLAHTSATNGLLINSMIPVLIVVLAALLLRQHSSWRLWGGITLSSLGILWLVSRGEWQQLLAFELNQGDLWVLLAALSWALYSLGLRFRPPQLSALAFLGFSVISGWLLLLPWSLYFATDLTAGVAEDWWAIVYVGLFPSALAFFCWNQGVKLLGAATAGQFIHLMPLMGLVMAWLLLGERWYSYHYWGSLAILAGLLLSLWPVAADKKVTKMAR